MIGALLIRDPGPRPAPPGYPWPEHRTMAQVAADEAELHAIARRIGEAEIGPMSDLAWNAILRFRRDNPEMRADMHLERWLADAQGRLDLLRAAETGDAA